MQVIWCLKFCNMTKSGGQSPAPNSGGTSPVIYAHDCELPGTMTLAGSTPGNIMRGKVCTAGFWSGRTWRAVKHIGCIRKDGRVDRVASTWFHAHSGARSPVRSRCRRCSTSGLRDVHSVPRTYRDSGLLQQNTQTMRANRSRLCANSKRYTCTKAANQ